MTSLDVWVGSRRVGTLARENYEYFFQYEDPGNLDPTRDLVSLTMPVRAKRYDTQILMPPFQLALPEGALLEFIRNRFAKLIDVTNDLVLLRLVGNNTIGRVRFSEPGQEPEVLETDDRDIANILMYPETDELFRELFEQLAAKSGISGVQPKLLWTERGSKAAVVASDYILKSSGPEYPYLALNEYLCLTAARAAGLSTPEFQLADSLKLLAVRRFDVDENRRLAFEETCALAGKPSSGKYAGSYEEVVDVIRKVPCEPVPKAMKDMFKGVVLSLRLRNGDAHWKNFGILYDDVSNKWLAPIYDVVSTTIYIPRDVPALSLAGKKAWPDRKDIEEFGLHACGLRKRDVRTCLEEVESGLESISSEIDNLSIHDDKAEQLCEHLMALAAT